MSDIKFSPDSTKYKVPFADGTESDVFESKEVGLALLPLYVAWRKITEENSEKYEKQIRDAPHVPEKPNTNFFPRTNPCGGQR